MSTSSCAADVGVFSALLLVDDTYITMWNLALVWTVKCSVLTGSSESIDIDCLLFTQTSSSMFLFVICDAVVDAVMWFISRTTCGGDIIMVHCSWVVVCGVRCWRRWVCQDRRCLPTVTAQSVWMAVCWQSRVNLFSWLATFRRQRSGTTLCLFVCLFAHFGHSSLLHTCVSFCSAALLIVADWWSYSYWATVFDSHSQQSW